MKIPNKLINQIKGKLDKAKILVVGDVMLDQYWFGEVQRISPEAPVPIARIDKTENRPGGAANVARNIKSLGGDVTLLSVVGNDNAASELKTVLKHLKIKHILKTDSTISTIVKLRVLARNQQLIRLDFEKKPSHEILTEVLDTYNQIIKDFDVIILSDYGKGGLHHTATMIKVANKFNKIVLIDPKGTDYSKYKNATLITPNKNELRDAVGNWASEDELRLKANALKKKLNLDYLLVTRSEEGMTLFAENKTATFPTVAKEVYDVSGAGDTVIATLSLLLANNINIQLATMIANIAAGIVVGKVGTATLTKQELLVSLKEFK
ncbi:MAG: D-glycero-beta-D-manno-heptose-7-phosphate kinase [Burkholderiales bacterium]|nr:D-glycero-beta-D-manno-heptose-7-phosphate kinase [Burkholderiales bacterium]